jgi:hypothetical protein
MYLIGKKHRHAMLFYLVGELLWLWESLRIDRLDMVFLCSVFSVLALRNWLRR